MFLTKEQFGRICEEIARRTSFLTKEQFGRICNEIANLKEEHRAT